MDMGDLHPVRPIDLGVSLSRMELPEIKPHWEHHFASEFHKRLIEMISDFEKELDDEHEVGVRLVSFGQTVTFHLVDMGYYDPALIRFYGVTPEEAPVELIQHVSQISVLLMKLPKLADKPRRLGFHSNEQSTDAD